MNRIHSYLGCLLLAWIWFSAPAQNKLSGYEYWFNNNFAAREIVNISPSTMHENSQSMDVANLPDGVNLFNIRYKNEEGFYSTTLSKLFYKAPLIPAEGNKLVSYEYWFNNDFIARQQVDIASATEHQFNESLDVSNLPDGVNLFNIRYQNSKGQYSATLSKLFYKAPSVSAQEDKLVSYEYWFNKDFENRQQVSFSAADEHQFSQDLDASTLPDGVNVLNIRHKNVKGQYSTILSRMFLKKAASLVTDNKIVAYKYWIDGNTAGADTTILPSATDLVFVDTSITLGDHLTGGNHTIAFQFKDLKNVWSVPYETSFFKDYEPRGSILASDAYSCPGTSVSFTSETIDVDAVLWDFGDGESSSDFNPTHAYVSPGEYTVTATISHIASGRSDEISLGHTIVVHPTYSTTDELTLCADELPYQFGQQSLFSPGEYTETFSSQFGCDSVVTLTLNLTPVNNPAIDAIADVVIAEDTEVNIPLTGISDGNSCETIQLGFTLSGSNQQLIQSYQVVHTDGESTGTLKITLTPDANGESDLTLVVNNPTDNKQTSLTFNLQVTAVNDAPVLIQPLSDLDKTTRDKFLAKFSSAIGVVFDDVDNGDQLALSVKQNDGSDLPTWLIFRNDSLISNTDLVETGCLDLILKAVDLAGGEASTSFSLCITFPVGIDDPAGSATIKVYPNPTPGLVYVEVPSVNEAGSIITVVDMTGKTVLQQQINYTGKIPVDLSELRNGIYFIRVENEGKQTIHKVVVSH